MCVQAFLVPQLCAYITYMKLNRSKLQGMDNIVGKNVTIDHLAGSFDSFAKSSAARLAVENVCDEKILRGVHYEGALFHVTTNSEERQVTHSTLGDKFLLLKGTLFLYFPSNKIDITLIDPLTFGVRMEIILGATATFTFRH